MRAHRLSAAALAAVLAGAGSGCATCDPEKPKVEPHAGGSIGTGTGGSWSALGIGFDVSNLFCRDRKAEEPPAEEGQGEAAQSREPAEDALPEDAQPVP